MWFTQTFQPLVRQYWLKHARLRRLLAGLVFSYALLGFVVIPWVLQAKLPTLLGQQTQAPVVVDTVRFNPFSLKLQIFGLDVQDQQQQSFFKAQEFCVNVNLVKSIWARGWVVEQFRLQNPVLQLRRVKEGQLNITSLLPPEDNQPASESSNVPFLVQHLQIEQGKLSWHDESVQPMLEEELTGINIDLENLGTLKDEVAKLNLASNVDADGEMHVASSFTLAQQNLQGHLELKQIPLVKLWEVLLKPHANYQILQGTADVQLDYLLNYQAGLQLQVHAGALTIHDLQIAPLAAAQSVISLPELNVEGVNLDLAQQDIHLGNLHAKQLSVNLARNAAGEYNLQTLFTPNAPPAARPVSATAPPTEAKLWTFTIDSLDLEQNHVEYSDQNPVQLSALSLPDVSLKIKQLKVATGAQKLQLQSADSELHVHGAKLTGYKFSPASKTLQAELQDFVVALKEQQLESGDKLQIRVHEGRVNLQNFVLNEPEAANPLVILPEFALQGLELDSAQRQINVAALSSSNALLRAWITAQGQINYQSLLVMEAAEQAVVVPPAASTEADNSAPWKMRLADLQLKNYQLELQDNSKAKPVQLLLAPIELQAKQLSNQSDTPVPFSLSTLVNNKGSIKITGTTRLAPLQTEAQLNISAFELLALQPYVNDYLRVDLIEGALDSALKLKLSQNTTQEPLEFNAQGSINVQNLVTRDQILNKDLIKWRALKLDGVSYNSVASSLNIDAILLQDPYARVTIKNDRSINFSDIIVPRSTNTAKANSEPTAQKTSFKYKIQAVNVSQGSSDFSDFSLILPFVVHLDSLNGAIKSIASEQTNFTDFKLAGKVFDLSPMNLQGKFKPNFSDLDIAMHFSSMPLPFISPYMVEFAGYKIEKGKMSLDLLYKVAAKQLTAENNMVLDQLTLGEKVENPKATSLPLNLAIALLKDSEGKISINMPIEGSLDDPQFSVGPLLWDAFTNVITRVVTSPFTALGALGNSEQDLSKVDFATGSDSLGAEQIKQLEHVANGLRQKPDLSIEIKGLAYEKQDWPALQNAALIDQLKAIKLAESDTNANGQRITLEHVELSPSEIKRLTSDLFVQKFPQLVKHSLLGRPELIAADQDFDSVAQQQLAAIIPPNRTKLLALAASRARNIVQFLTQQAGIAHERVYILDGDVKADSAPGELSSELALKVQ